jgi:2-hydroxycyclohexanecarboxyl-CoA dehydrogenase
MRARFDAEGDVIVITGGANGIGRALACAAAEAGARVVVCDVDEPAMAALSDVPGIATRRLDVSDHAGTLATLHAVERDFGRIDGLVCAAPFSRGRSFTRWTRRSGIACCGSISPASSGATRRWSPA